MAEESWQHKLRAQIVVVFRRDYPGDYGLYGWIRQMAAETGMTPGSIVKVAVKAGKSQAREKAREYSQSVRRAQSKLNE